MSLYVKRRIGIIAYIATGEVTTLEHEVGDDTVETRSLVTETVLAGAKLAEVARRARHHVVVQHERSARQPRARGVKGARTDAPGGLAVDAQVELRA